MRIEPEASSLSETEQPFVHLRVHSAYSLLEGALTIPHLVTLAAEQRMPALSLTDTNNLFGALEFSEGLVTLSHLALHQAGLIALTGGPDGVIDRAIAANDFRFAETALNQLKSIFGDRLYVEL